MNLKKQKKNCMTLCMTFIHYFSIFITHLTDYYIYPNVSTTRQSIHDQNKFFCLCILNVYLTRGTMCMCKKIAMSNTCVVHYGVHNCMFLHITIVIKVYYYLFILKNPAGS